MKIRDVLHAHSIAEAVDIVLHIKTDDNNFLCFRGEGKDHEQTAIQPSIYRNPKHLMNEHKIYREIQRYNEQEFKDDTTAYDRLLRIQHHMNLTRLADVSEDITAGMYFALEKDQNGKDPERPVLYVLEIDSNKVKYYDSDAVSVVANLACSPLENKEIREKSKAALWRDARSCVNRGNYGVKEFNQTESAKYLLHDIKAEKSYFEPLIVPEHLFSVFYVKPKHAFKRIRGQKGAALLFGLNYHDYTKSINLLDGSQRPEWSPVVAITKIYLEGEATLNNLEKLGITKAYIYPDLQSVGDYLKNLYAEKK